MEIRWAGRTGSLDESLGDRHSGIWNLSPSAERRHP
jgi:hypothetical protein